MTTKEEQCEVHNRTWYSYTSGSQTRDLQSGPQRETQNRLESILQAYPREAGVSSHAEPLLP